MEQEPWTPPPDAKPEMGLLQFVRQAWRILEPAVPFVETWHIAEQCEHAEALSTGQLLERDVAINTPPGTSKSMLWMVMWPAWEWTWAPWTRWLTSSYDDGLALRDAVKTRTLMQSDWYQSHIALDWSFTSYQNVKGYYLNNRTGWRVATSMSGGNTGWHAHRVAVDDPHNVKTAESDAVREETVKNWREVYPSRADLPGSVRVLIGQRTHEQDCFADWLSRERKSIHHVEFKMEYEEPTKAAGGVPSTAAGGDREPNNGASPDSRLVPPNGAAAPGPGDPVNGAAVPSRTVAGWCSWKRRPHDIRTQEGELLAPERFGPAVIAKRKIELGPYAYAGQYQQSPTPRVGMLLDPGWFQQTPRLERATVDLIAAFDLNYSDAETSDWTVGMLGAVDRTPVFHRIHVIDAFRDHLSEKKHPEHIANWLLLWRPIMVGIEKRAYEKEGATRDLCRQIAMICSDKGYAVTIEPIDVEGDKVTRAMIIPGRAKAGLITVDKNTTWWPILSSQMSSFPKSTHDDDVDALAHLVKLAVEKLEKIRGQMNLMGHSAELHWTEGGTQAPADWERAAAMGLR